MHHEKRVTQEVRRGAARARFGQSYYRVLRYLLWMKMKKRFARQKEDDLTCCVMTHKTPLLRELAGVDMQYQHNKVVNLGLAVAHIDGVVIKPGQIFSYWRLIGKPSKRKGYLDGIQLKSGKVDTGIGGGLCQLSNLIFWMTLHTPLTIIERHRHGYDVFPDVSRRQPFGRGATCYYPHGDLMIQNNTDQTFQLKVRVGETHLLGEWRAEQLLTYRYRIVEKNHRLVSEYWGGYSRHNQLYRQVFDKDGKRIDEELVVTNSAIMMYSPFIGDDKQE
ncbi:MAG: VanW family protein [Eubacteriales bacterium]